MNSSPVCAEVAAKSNPATPVIRSQGGIFSTVAACRTDLCRQGRSPCPTPSACVGLVQLQGRLEQVVTCATHKVAPPIDGTQLRGLYGLHDTPIGATTKSGDVHQEARCLRWLVPTIAVLSIAASFVWPWGVA